MTGFINRILNRNAYPQNHIVPRLPGKFETAAFDRSNFFDNDVNDSSAGLSPNSADLEDRKTDDNLQPNAPAKPLVYAGQTNDALPNKIAPGDTSLHNLQNEPQHTRDAVPVVNGPKSISPGENTRLLREENSPVTLKNPILNQIDSTGDQAIQSQVISHHYQGDSNARSSGSPQFSSSAVIQHVPEPTAYINSQPLFTTPPLQNSITSPLLPRGTNALPVIKVHIGRIEIKAISQPAATETRSKNSGENKPAMSLDDYLKEKRPLMSTALRIASVTYVLKDLLNNGLINHDVTGAIGEIVAVSALPPDKLKPEEEHTQLNLFMYQATYNSGWRNIAEPSVSNKGDRISNPPLAIDLHYLLSAYGSAELHTEVLLGYGMQLMHENPILGREAISTALKAPSSVPGVGLPSSLRILSTSKLAEQVEMIKITPEVLSIEDISKLWAAFGTRYRPTAAYKITVVLIESSKSARAALPVKGRKIYVAPFKKPVIEAVASQSAANQGVIDNQKILPGYRLVLKGTNLDSMIVDILVDGLPVPLSPDTTVEDKQIGFSLPANLDAGMHEVQVVHSRMMGSPPAAHTGVSSNTIVFVLSPVITNLQVSDTDVAADATWSATIRFDINPAVSPKQKLTLYLNMTGGPAQAYSFPVALPDTPSPPDFFTTLNVPIHGVIQGNYLVRVYVDGAESVLQADAAGTYITPSAIIP